MLRDGHARSAPAPTRRASPATTRGSALYWLVTGKTVGGTALYPEANRLDREEALRLYTSAAPGSRARRARRARSCRASSPTSRCCRPTTSRSPRSEIKRHRIGADGRRRQGRLCRRRRSPRSPRRRCRSARLVAGRSVRRLPPSPAARRPRVTQAHARAHGTHGLLHRSLGRIRRDRPEPLWGGLGCEMLGVLSRRYYTRLAVASWPAERNVARGGANGAQWRQEEHDHDVQETTSRRAGWRESWLAEHPPHGLFQRRLRPGVPGLPGTPRSSTRTGCGRAKALGRIATATCRSSPASSKGRWSTRTAWHRLGDAARRVLSVSPRQVRSADGPAGGKNQRSGRKPIREERAMSESRRPPIGFIAC